MLFDTGANEYSIPYRYDAGFGTMLFDTGANDSR